MSAPEKIWAVEVEDDVGMWWQDGDEGGHEYTLTSTIPTWRTDIENAPRGKPVMVWDEYYLMRIAMWDVMNECFCTDAPCIEDTPIALSPTHWQPLPAPPQTAPT